ncbi:MAG: guanine deaminase [Deltaproteobacteria bacterium]|nr:guanine deaminase [Deltaproteobacteria bacterium]
MTTYRASLLTPTAPDAVRYLPDALVEVDAGGTIRTVDEVHGVTARVDHDLRPGLLTPGFVDAHIHYPQTRVVGRASGPLLPWLQHTVFPEEARFSDPQHAARVAATFCDRLSASGTTLALVYGSAHPEAADILFQTMDARGLRAIAGPVLMDDDCPDALCHPREVALPALEALAARWHDHDRGRLRVAVIPRFALSCSPEMLAEAGALAARLGLPISTHLSENLDECALTCARFGAPDYLSVYERAGLCRPGAVFAHAIHLSDSEWQRLSASQAVLAHCPDSNDFLGSGGMDIGRARALGVPVAIGTDIAAGRTFRIPRVLSSAYDNARRQGTELTPAELFWLGTRGGALALSTPEVGAIEPGLEADMVLFDLPADTSGSDAVLDALIFDHDSGGVRSSWVRGGRVFGRGTA